ncbi:MAG: hypothetical protein LBI05_05830 [Planctomycetaceae bacterium]|jgi:hypothetical protein|nr:hypothetical protein [Planctomycetaceae bacterium]
MNRTEKINQILKERQKIAEKTDKTIENIRAVESALYSCSSLLKRAMGILLDEQRVNAEQLQGELERIINTKIQQIRQRVSQLGLRFNRKTFNIGVTGNAGIGKSQLLQSLTGLPNDLIPARNPKNPMGGSCTGAPSVIVNNTDSDRVYADVEFYQEADFFEEIIKPYYRALDPEQKWLPSPSNFYEFANSPFPSLPAESSGNTRIRNLYDALKLRQTNANQYQRDFGRRLPNVEKPDEIRRYVAQKDKDNRPIMDWIPVKMVMIYCPFKGRDGERITDQISVCDTPGLGDIGCKADDNLMRNIAENVDAVWMLNMITAASQIVKQSDSDLYALIDDAVPEWTPQDWVYGVINRYTDANSQHVEVFRQELKKRHIDVRNVYDLDARQPEDVLSVFHSTLDDIVENQKVLDEKLYNARYDQVKQLFDEIVKLTGSLMGLFPAQGGDATGFMTAIAKFDQEIWKKLGNKLNVLVKKFAEQKEKDNDEFLNNLKELESELAATPGLPTQEEFAYYLGTVGLRAGHSFECQKIRRLIIGEFDRMDQGFTELFDRLRDEAKECFTAEDGGKLGNIVFPSDGDTTQSWWALLADEIGLLGETELSKNIARRIASALRKFDEATLSFRGFLLPRVLPHLDTLDPDGSAHAPFEPRVGDSIEEFISKIDAAAQQGIGGACGAIRQFAKEPSMSLFASVEEMRDAVMRTGDAIAAAQVWSNFYAEHRAEIWSDVFQKKEADVKFRKEWHDAVEKLKAAINAGM